MILSVVLSFVCLSLAGFARAKPKPKYEPKPVYYNWNVTWVWASHGDFGRSMIGINGEWPCPTMEANVGDTVVVTLHNQLGNQTTGMHFHGINQVWTPDMDGSTGSTQCPIPPGSSLTYRFTVDGPGTFWYHSHDMGQYPDGLRGPFIVHDLYDPYKKDYDDEYILTISDWYRNSSIVAVQNMLTTTNVHFAPPLPDDVLVNEGKGSLIPFKKGKTTRVRIINFAAFGSAMVHFDSHTMQVIANDADYVKKQEAYQLRLAPSQRYDVLISAIDRDNGNFPFLVSLDINRDWTNYSSLAWPHNYTGYLVMDDKGDFTKKDVVDKWQPLDESHLQPYNGAKAFDHYDKLIKLDVHFCLDKNGIPRSCINNITYIPQRVPTLYSAATTGDENTNPIIYGQVNPYIIDYDDVVQIVVNNRDDASHPFHLHGHHFQVLDRPVSGTGDWPGRDVNYAATPPVRDTVAIMAKSFAVLRFKADNPGIWLFHCHIEWHVEMGLTATIIEAPDRLRGRKFPKDHIDACERLKIPYRGNAAGNVDDPTDTTGFVTVPPTTYNGASYVAN